MRHDEMAYFLNLVDTWPNHEHEEEGQGVCAHVIPAGHNGSKGRELVVQNKGMQY